MPGDTFVERQPIRVLRVKADFAAGGPKAAFDVLESKLAGLKGRRFFGTFHLVAGRPEYYACVEAIESEDGEKLGLEEGKIPGGLYVRQKASDWQKLVAEDMLAEMFRNLADRHDHDPTRPTVEFYRSMTELHLLVPVASRR